MSPKLKDAGERAARTFIQASTGAVIPLLVVDGAAWDDIPKAASVGAFAGIISWLMALNKWSAPRKSEPTPE